MSKITAKEIRSAFPSAWPNWRDGQRWLVPIIPKFSPSEDDTPLELPLVTAVEYRAEAKVNRMTGKSVWVFYGKAGDLELVLDVIERK